MLRNWNHIIRNWLISTFLELSNFELSILIFYKIYLVISIWNIIFKKIKLYSNLKLYIKNPTFFLSGYILWSITRYTSSYDRPSFRIPIYFVQIHHSTRWILKNSIISPSMVDVIPRWIKTVHYWCTMSRSNKSTIFSSVITFVIRMKTIVNFFFKVCL